MNKDTDTPEIYMIDDANRLFRKGEHIGDLDGNDMKLLPDCKNYQASVTRWLRSKADEIEKAPAKPADEAPKVKLTEDQKAALENQGMTDEAVREASKSRELYRSDVEHSERTGCPPPPKKNPQFGDKTPAFVDWLNKYRPDEFKVRYGVKNTGKVPYLKMNPDTGIEEVVGYREAVFSARKTHLTELLETNTGLGEDMDWNA